MRNFWYCSVIFLCFNTIVLANSSEQGSSWLRANQQFDGGIYAVGDVAAEFQSTHEAHALLAFTKSLESGSSDAVKNYLAAYTGDSTEILAAKLMSGIVSDENYESIIHELQNRQDSDGGFGDRPGYHATPYDSYWAIMALDFTGNFPDPAKGRAVAYLLNEQSSVGGWQHNDIDSIYLSARIAQLLTVYSSQHMGVPEALAKAQVFLSTLENAPSRELFEQCSSLSALSISAASTNINNLADRIAASQSSDGSWQQDVFTTALCLRAQIQYEAFKNGIPAGLNSVYGKVVASGSAEPLKNATVIVRDGANELTTFTNNNGYFSLSGITNSPVNIVASKNGYQSAVLPVDISSGSADAGTISLAWSPDLAAVFGEVVDGATGLPIASASVSIPSGSTVTDGAGKFFIGDLSAGTYPVTVTKSGYSSLSTSLLLDAGELMRARLLLNPDGTVLNDSPAALSGVIIDGVSRQPVTAQVILDGVTSQTASATGSFVFTSVERGDHLISVSAAGFNDAQYQVVFPIGANGYVGELPLYEVSDQQAPDSLGLRVTVLDAISRLPIEAAQLSLSTGEVAVTDQLGGVFVAGLTSLSFSIELSAEGYHSAQYELVVDGYGMLSTELYLTPHEGELLGASTVSGVVTDEDGLPIEGVSVVLVGDTDSVLTDAAGYFEIGEIDELAFEIVASKTGYLVNAKPIEISAHGNYEINFTLSDIDEYNWYISYINTPAAAVGAEEDIKVYATVQNLTAAEENVIVRGKIVAADGAVVATLPSFLPGTSTIAGAIAFSGNETQTIELRLFTGQIPAGTYTLYIEVVQDGSVSRDLPTGVVYTSEAANIAIGATTGLDGGIDFSPPLSQAGSTIPVVMQALVRNAGNRELPQGSYQITLSEENGTVILQTTVDGTELGVGELLTLDFGEWVPTVTGHLTVSITLIGVPEAGEITDIYYVGDVATAEFTLNRYVVPEGNSQVQGRIDIRGVDTTQGTSTDPLFEQVQESVEKGGQYVGPQAIAWHNHNRCLGCHVQTQSLVGMASSLGRVDVDPDQARFLYNVIASSQQAYGGLYISHSNLGRTQTGFGAWSLVDWPSKDSSYRTKYNALAYLWERRSVDGDQLYWSDEHNSGWFRIDHDATTAVVARAIVDIISSDKELGAAAIRAPAGASQFPLEPQQGYPTGTAVISDREVLIAKQGSIESIDVDTGESKVEFVDQAGRRFYDVDIDEFGVIYATTDNRVVKIESGVVVDELLIADGLRDIEYLGGQFYVAEWNSDRIWRVSPDLQAEVFASGGLLQNPQGLAVSHNDSLLIANHSGFNILEADGEGNLSVFADGFAYPPHQLTLAEIPGEYYIATRRYSRSGSIKPPSITLLREDRTLEGLFANRNEAYSVYSLAVLKNRLFFTDIPSNSLGEVVFADMDRSLIQTLENSLPNIANYFLNRYTRTESETLYIAFRLVGLGEIYNIVQDESLKTTIEGAMQHLDQLLRERQRADGGWGQYTSWGSDPLTTSWVGIALDYLNPSAEDPVVRGAITYLLGQQSGNGSWWGRYFGTRLGTTSMVMAYMPRALDRLAGLDVTVNLEIPAKISLTDMSPQPTSQAVTASGTEQLHWQLTGVTGSGQEIDLDMVVSDMQAGESRAVATSAGLAFANSFTGEIISQVIDTPSVTAVSNLGLSVATDKTQYGADAAVDIFSTLVNGGSSLEEGNLIAEVYTDEGYLVTQLSDQSAVLLESGQQANYQYQWNTATFPAGDYHVRTLVVDSTGELRVEATARFAILPSDGQQPSAVSYGANINSDKSVYQAYDAVLLSPRVLNETINSSLDPVLVKTRVVAPNGNVLLSTNRVIPEMAPSEIRAFEDSLMLKEAEPGAYMALIEIWDAAAQELLASDTTYFGVIDQPLAHLLGEVSVSDSSVFKGQTVSCSNAVFNRSLVSTVDVTIDYLLVNIDSQAEIALASEGVQLTPETRALSIQSHDTSTLDVGGYACLLLATINGEQVTLAYGGFEVTPPPVTVTSGFGNKGRLLVLLDDPAGNSNGELSSLQSQYQYLVQLLDEFGYSYTIVFSGEVFEQELYSDLYHSYALMSEHVSLSPEVEQVLTEAVNEGDGLLISGAFNRRNGHVERALGISITGRETQADGVLIPGGALGDNWVETVINPGIKLDFERCGARLLGAYINPVKGTETTEATCYDNSGLDAAAAGHRYGKGYAVYIGFDTLDEATTIGGENTYRSILGYALGVIQPEQYRTVTGSVVPVEHLILADEIAVLARVTIDLPDNLTLVDQVPELTLLDEMQNVWSWQGALAAWEDIALIQYLRLLDEQEALVEVTVETSLGQDWFVVNSYRLAIDPHPFGELLAESITLLESVGDSQILTNVRDAQTALSAGDNALATTEILRALDKLSLIDSEPAIQARELLDQQLFILLAAR